MVFMVLFWFFQKKERGNSFVKRAENLDVTELRAPVVHWTCTFYLVTCIVSKYVVYSTIIILHDMTKMKEICNIMLYDSHVSR